MAHFPFLIVGGGMTADAAAGAIRKHRPGAAIAIVGTETHSPYDRPPLTKGLWKDKPLETIWREAANLGIEWFLGRTVRGIEPNAHRAIDDTGEEYTYDKLLLATGAEPRRLPNAPDGIVYFRTLDDYRRLRELALPGRKIAVIGGGFIGSEIAAALAMNLVETTMIFPDEGICGRILPRSLAAFMTGLYRSRGVEMLPGTNVESIAARKRGGYTIGIKAKEGGSTRTIEVDAIVAGIGVAPRIELAKGAGLEVGNGIVVSEMCQTSQRDIYAAGDAARFFNPALQALIRVEHEDNANAMGEAAGRNMTGNLEPYRHLPFFYSDLFSHGYEAIGETSSELETYIDWKEENREGFIYYLHEGRVRGLLAWNSYGHMDEARAMIEDHRRIDRPDDLKGRLAA